MTASQLSRERLLERAEVVARTIVSQQTFYQSFQCTPNQRQLLETTIGAAIWYFPQSEDLWTGSISVAALKMLAASSEPKKVKLTKEHHYPRKVAAAELFALDWSKVTDQAQEVLSRFQNCYGRFNYVLPEENKRVGRYQKTSNFVSPATSYAQAGIELKKISNQFLKAIRAGDRRLAGQVLSGDAE